jgi:hypothetical protein
MLVTMMFQTLSFRSAALIAAGVMLAWASVTAIAVQLAIALLLLRREFQNRLDFSIAARAGVQ